MNPQPRYRRLRPFATVVWKAYCFVYFRLMMAGHWLKGDIGFRTFWAIFLPPRWRPAGFDYFNDLPHGPGKLPGDPS